MRTTLNLSFTRWLAAALVASGVLVLQAEEPALTPITPVTGEVAAVAAPTSEVAVVAAPTGEVVAVVVPTGEVVVVTAPTGSVVTVTAPAAQAIPAGMPVAATSSVPETIAMPGFASPAETQERISIALDDVPLQDVVRMFTRISGANIIATSTNLGGKVTVNLQDVEWKPALGAILDMYNLQISEKTPASGIYSVMPKAPGAEDPLTAATIFLNYASVSNVAVLVQPLLGRGGSVSPFPNCNALVVRGTATTVNEIRKVVTEIDLPRKQVYIEAKFLELSDDAIKDLGINWQVLQNYGVGAAGMQVGLKQDTEKQKSSATTLTRNDNRSVVDTVNQGFDANGKPYPDSAASPQRTVVDTINQGAVAQQTLQNSVTKTLSDIRTATLSADDFKIILSALKQQNGASIISNPKVIVANEQTATIHIGENDPNIKGTVTSGQQGQANSITYALDPTQPYFEFGIKLDVTPVINNASNITVTINPTLSTHQGDKVTPDNNTFPIAITKTIATTFSLASGRTAAIGGLTKTGDTKQEIKVPLLGDIPIIGKYLFTYSHTDRSQDETIIFVTVTIATPDAIERAEGLPEDAELVHQHLKNIRKSMGGFPGTVSPTAATPTAPAVMTPKALDQAATPH